MENSANGKIYQVGYKNDEQKADQRLKLAGLAAILLLGGTYAYDTYGGKPSHEKASFVDEYVAKSSRHIRFVIESGPFKGKVADANLGGVLISNNVLPMKPGQEVDVTIKKGPISGILYASDAVPKIESSPKKLTP